ncbi:bacteriophage tail completion protein R (plasmid) [Zymomonas mobilis subsp. mobilis ZM4 = ATCC 31821]|uniref:phage tail protein n=1 Tax=Zymomonas mobilis TaxID=542 RepID=UPI0007809F17|nr:phage tail protein [Zymomonas mobilis]AVZ26861.1 bacteriophage tail completion protein R [Zymomonas mobilis subsp. mobilis]AVZ28780.1 bacteriophage tail completion protein R [Zymomonas mobilis subsp. mobilis]AVZ43193.1 bacteriophage tail completion protein R [Zymomonas mobilis subsp. mobilis ZM4 = ATCC 31821]UBQ08719.1 phage tail protein [Zymomonas mobilis]
MKKSDLLKNLLLQKFAYLQQSPEKLDLIVTGGTVRQIDDNNTNFVISYSVLIAIDDYSTHISLDDLFLLLNDFVHEQQHDLLHEKNNEPYQFEINQLDDDRALMMVRIDLSEIVLVTNDENGNRVAEHQLETSGVIQSETDYISKLIDITGDGGPFARLDK